MTRAPSICGIVIASGAYPPYATDLALQPWPPGDHVTRETFLSAHIKRLQPHTDLVIVVAGKNANVLAPTVYTQAAFMTVNSASELGPFSSLKLGIQEVLSRGRDAAFISYVNRPPVREATISRLHGEFLGAVNEDQWAVVPQFEDECGAPFVIGREMIEVMLRAPLTSTEHDVIRANPAQVRTVSVDDAAVVVHVETADDYHRLIEAVQ